MIAIDAKTGRELWKTEPAGDPKDGYAFTVRAARREGQSDRRNRRR